MTTTNSVTIAAPRHFDKCLKTLLRHGTKPEEQRYYFLPYTGNLTKAKFLELAAKLHKAVAHHYHPKAYPAPEAFLNRLMSEWYTGREKNVSMSRYEHNGNWLLQGEGWFMSNYPDGHIIVVEA
jgi:hypothetical protein